MVDVFSYIRTDDQYIPLIFIGISLLGIVLFTYSLSHISFSFLEKIWEAVIGKYQSYKRKSRVSPKLLEIINAQKDTTFKTVRRTVDSFRWLVPGVVITSARTMIIFSLVGVLGLTIGTVWLKNVGAALILAFICILLPGQLLSRKDIRKQEAYIKQFSPAVRTFLVSLESKGNVRMAIAEVANKSPEPTKSLFQTVLWRLDASMPPAKAMSVITKEIKFSHAHIFVQLMIEAYRQGSTLLPQFTRLAGQVDAMYKLTLENSQVTASGRLQNVIMHILVVVIAVMMKYVLPESEKYLTEEPVGRTIVVLTFLSVLIGFIFDRMMGKVDV